MLSFKKKLLIFLATLLPILLVAAWSVCDQIKNNYVIDVNMKGEALMMVEYGESFSDPGISASGYGRIYDRARENLSVSAVSNVNTEKIGNYQITYTISYKNTEKVITRKVLVQDTTAPQIYLTEDATYTLPGTDYQEAGYTATDNYDGDLTSLVEREEKDGSVYYTVTDQAGNTATAVRPIPYDDPIPPTLYIKGDETIAMTAGKEFQDPGYFAFDNCDGDITDQIKVVGAVDGFTPGTYTLQYKVEDGYGNGASVVRTVVVTDHPVQEYVENPQKIIYLTFDDGPGPYTAQLLDILSKYHVKATFFVVNTGYISMVQRIAAEGHTVALHTATHKFREVYASEDAYFADLTTIQTVVKEFTGVESKILRFPGGSSNTISSFNRGIMTRLTKLVKEQGFRYFDWNVDSGDAGGATSRWQVTNNVINGIGNKQIAVVLQHDIKGYSVEAVEDIIVWGLENGYTFLPLNENSPVCEHNIYN